jgi:large subunit ribosomal protein L25
MALQLAVESRDTKGKHRNRRLRESGKIPAVLYGHGLESVSLSVATEILSGAIRHGSRLVNLTGAVNESAFIRDLQWDTWGTHVVHVDFTRISENEIVEVRVPVELHGEAPGVREGGVVSQMIHEIDLACPASLIPERLLVNINQLALDEKVLLSAVEVPEGAKILAADMEVVVVHCHIPVELPEEGAAEAVPGEPEVIGAKAEDEEGEESDEKEKKEKKEKK